MAGKDNLNTYPDAPPVPVSIGNNQSSIINLEVPCSPAPLQPDSLVPRSLLYSAYTSHPAYLSAHDLLSFFYFVTIRVNLWFIPFLVSSWLQLNYAKQTQFQNRQNSLNSLPQKVLCAYSSSSPPKKQTQTNPIHPGKALGAAGYHNLLSVLWSPERFFSVLRKAKSTYPFPGCALFLRVLESWWLSSIRNPKQKHLSGIFGGINILSRNVWPVLPGLKGGRL